MLLLMDFRNKWLDIKDDRQHRDHRRMDGRLTWRNDQLVHGPHTQENRQNPLRAILEAQQAFHGLRKDDEDNLQMVAFEELEEIRRIWVKDKHELEGSLPEIFAEATGTEYPGKPHLERQALGPGQLEELRHVCDEHGDRDVIVIQTLRNLPAPAHRFRAMAREYKQH